MKPHSALVNPDRNRLIQETFITEGTMVAFPLCFPGETTQIRADESRITALAIDGSGLVYGGTSGAQCHLFVGMFNGVTGAVLDLGMIDGGDHCTAVCCGTEHVIMAVNGANGGRLVRRELEALPFDLLQEWDFAQKPLHDLGSPAPGEAILDAVTAAGGKAIIGVTATCLFRADFVSGRIESLCQLTGSGGLGASPWGDIFGRADDHTLWCLSAGPESVERDAVPLPESGNWSHADMHWAAAGCGDRLFTADASGQLYALHRDTGFSDTLGQTPFAPVTSMSVSLDGRLFGTCGDGIEHLFCYTPDTDDIRDLGCIASVIERRRYGYEFADAVTGPDGQIYFAENDNLGHLWIYFPRITPAIRQGGQSAGGCE